MEQVTVYTDGGCTHNPGVGGYGIVILRKDKSPILISKGFERTTNNRMELMAVIETMKIFKDKDVKVEIFTDSKYITDSVNLGWIYKWKSKNFEGTKNPDLWKKLLNVLTNKITLSWVKGHSGNKYNEMADKLSKEARSGVVEKDTEFLKIEAENQKSKIKNQKPGSNILF